MRIKHETPSVYDPSCPLCHAMGSHCDICMGLHSYLYTDDQYAIAKAELARRGLKVSR
jgi:hypothetical protein